MGRMAWHERGVVGREQEMGATHRLERSIVLGAASAAHHVDGTMEDPVGNVMEMGPKGRRRGTRRQ